MCVGRFLAKVAESVKQRSRWQRWIIRFAQTVMVLCVLLTLGFVIQGLVAGAKLKSVLASFEADGIPLSWPAYYSQFPDLDRHLAAQSNLFAALDRLSAAPAVRSEERRVGKEGR